MNTFKKIVLTLAMGLGFSLNAHATNISLNADGNWSEFNVDDFSSISLGTEWIDLTDSNSPDFGTPLHFVFSIAQGFKGLLTVVDAGFSGDRFEIFNAGNSLGTTSTTQNNSDYSNDFDSNLNNINYSKRSFWLNEGSYVISGSLFSTLQSFNATNGALKLEITKAQVSEPAAYIILLSGLAALAFARRRRT